MLNRKVHKVQVQGKIENQAEARSLLRSGGDLALVIRGRMRNVVLRCPCGCGEDILLNADSRVGPAWRVYQTSRGFTLFPSVWRENGCKSHFVVWNDAIYWCDIDDEWGDTTSDGGLDDIVFGALSHKGLTHYRDIAESINEVPWSVLASCRRLVRRGLLQEGSQLPEKGFFKRKGLDLKV